MLHLELAGYCAPQTINYSDYMSTRNHVTGEQREILSGLWEEGMITLKRKDLLKKAVDRTGLEEQTIKNWIGNQKKLKGMAVNRGERERKQNLPSKIRKKSAFTVFKSEYLSSETVKKLKEDGVSYADIQKQGNLAYQQLSSEEKQKYETMATTANENLTSSSGKLSKEKMIKRITNNIESNMKRLDELGCPSIWLGYGMTVPQRLYSPQMAELANDDVFTNYVVSKMFNKLARSRMENAVASSTSSNKIRRAKERQKNSAHTSKDANVSTESDPETRGESRTDVDLSQGPSNAAGTSLEVGTEVELLSANGVLLGHGVVTEQTAVHGCELSYGWVPLMVKTIKTNVKPWAEFPTHSGEVEKDSFVAWPKAFLKRKSFEK